MSTGNEFKTQTMARLYMRQGYYEKAVEIYRYLTEADPDRDDLKNMLTEAEEILAANREDSAARVSSLIRQWYDLANRYRALKRLQGASRQGNPDR